MFRQLIRRANLLINISFDLRSTNRATGNPNKAFDLRRNSSFRVNQFNAGFQTNISFPIHRNTNKKSDPNQSSFLGNTALKGKQSHASYTSHSPNALDIGNPPSSSRNQHLLRLRDKFVHGGINPSNNHATPQLSRGRVHPSNDGKKRKETSTANTTNKRDPNENTSSTTVPSTGTPALSSTWTLNVIINSSSPLKREKKEGREEGFTETSAKGLEKRGKCPGSVPGGLTINLLLPRSPFCAPCTRARKVREWTMNAPRWNERGKGKKEMENGIPEKANWRAEERERRKTEKGSR